MADPSLHRPRGLTARHLTSRGGVAAVLIAFGLTFGTPAAAAPSAPVTSTSPSEPGPVDPGFSTKAAPLATGEQPVMGGLPGRPLSESAVRPALTRTQAEGDLTVKLSATQVENFWFHNDGVTATVTGLFAGDRVVFTDTSPDGTVETFDPAQVDAQGRASLILRPEALFPQVGMHVITAASANSGRTGSVSINVIQYAGRTLKVSNSKQRLTRYEWRTTPVTVSASGLRPKERLTITVEEPDGTMYQVGQGDAPRADEKGNFAYVLQATNANTPQGPWRFIITGASGLNGDATLTITAGAPAQQRGTLAFAAATVPAANLPAGVKYALSGFKPWDVVALTLRDPNGIDVILGRYRLDGDGKFADVLSSTNPPAAGRYSLTARSIATNAYAVAPLTLTAADGSIPAALTLKANPSTVSRLTAMDPQKGIVVTATGLRPGATAYLDIGDVNSQWMALSSTSLAVKIVAADGTVTFRVVPKRVPAAGDYFVRLEAYPARLQAPLVISS